MFVTKHVTLRIGCCLEPKATVADKSVADLAYISPYWGPEQGSNSDCNYFVWMW